MAKSKKSHPQMPDVIRTVVARRWTIADTSKCSTRVETWAASALMGRALLHVMQTRRSLS
jgi:hypothetical protein